MSRQQQPQNVNKLINDLKNRVADLEKVNDEKLCLLKLSESFGRAVHDLRTCTDAFYVRGREFDKLEEDLITAQKVIFQKANKSFVSKKQEKEDDVLYLDQKNKFFGTEPKVVHKASQTVKTV